MRKILSACLLLTALILPIRAASDPNVWYSCSTDERRIALTFDDGPHYKYTAEVLDILDEFGIKATFFVVGDLAERYPELVLRELSEGHEVASHTWSHPHLAGKTEAELIREMAATEQLLVDLAGYRPTLFRPPEGACGDAVKQAAAKLGYKVILWTVDTRDWDHTPSDTIVDGVLENTEPGSIILCHDFVGGISPTPDALRKFIPKLLADGYEFVTVSELIGDTKNTG